MKQKKHGLTIILILSLILSIYPSSTAYAKSETPKQITLSSKSQTIYTKQTITLKVKKVTPKGAVSNVKWSSSNKKVAKVTKDGKVTGVKAGTATITAVSKKDKNVKASCKIKVLNFKTKAIKAKKSYTTASSSYLESSGKTYKVIKSYDELLKFKKEMQKVYAKNHSNKADFSRTGFGKKLNLYNKSYFKSKVLCIMEGSTPSSSRKVKTGDLKLSQNKKGKVYANLYVAEKLPGKDVVETCDIQYQQYFIELNQKDIKGVQRYRIIKKYI